MKIANIIMLYKNVDEIIEYTKKLERLNHADNIELIIVVNNIGDTTTRLLDEKFMGCKIKYFIYYPPNNIGYFNGFIYGINAYLNDGNTLPEWIILCNTDIDFLDRKFLDPFFENKYADDVWCVGPSIYVPEGKRYQNPECIKRRSRYKVKRLLRIFYFPLLGSIYIRISFLKHRFKFYNFQKPESEYVYEIHGAFFVFRNMFVNYIKDKPFKALLYSEETYVAEHMLICEKKTYYDSDIEIVHNEHSTTGKTNMKFKCKNLYKSMKEIYDEFYLK